MPGPRSIDSGLPSRHDRSHDLGIVRQGPVHDHREFCPDGRAIGHGTHPDAHGCPFGTAPLAPGEAVMFMARDRSVGVFSLVLARADGDSAFSVAFRAAHVVLEPYLHLQNYSGLLVLCPIYHV